MRHRSAMSWRQQWAPYARISRNLKRAVIASEDAGFAEHGGVDWDALEKAWERNQRAEASAERANARAERTGAAAAGHATPKSSAARPSRSSWRRTCFLSGERTWLRKGQELVARLILEALLAQAAHPGDLPEQRRVGRRRVRRRGGGGSYFRSPRGYLSVDQAARLAVMLPAPKRFEKRPDSAYVAGAGGDHAGADGRGGAALSRAGGRPRIGAAPTPPVESPHVRVLRSRSQRPRRGSSSTTASNMASAKRKALACIGAAAAPPPARQRAPGGRAAGPHGAVPRRHPAGRIGGAARGRADLDAAPGRRFGRI